MLATDMPPDPSSVPNVMLPMTLAVKLLPERSNTKDGFMGGLDVKGYFADELFTALLAPASNVSHSVKSLSNGMKFSVHHVQGWSEPRAQGKCSFLRN
jgi:hypothetical protein